MIYKYKDRYIVEFSNKTRASYSKKRYGELLEKITSQSEKEDIKIWNYYIEYNDYIEILYWEQKTQNIKSILIDKDIKWIIYKYYIQLNANGYPQTRTGGNKQFLHHLVMNSTGLIDHINHNPLDNRKKNLRICNTCSDNCINQSVGVKNSSGHIGVWFDKTLKERPWRARFQYKYKEYNKYFKSYEEACQWIDNQKEYIINNQKTFND